MLHAVSPSLTRDKVIRVNWRVVVDVSTFHCRAGAELSLSILNHQENRKQELTRWPLAGVNQSTDEKHSGLKETTRKSWASWHPDASAMEYLAAESLGI